ncbi:MAG: acetyltransferase [halophilic archaeon J07HB67]|nr:MAG: acetyltransferase [halophilic archaeon J07HB67]
MAVTDGEADEGVVIRQARESDVDDVVAFTRETWSDQEGASDYLPETFPEWIGTDGPEQRTFVAAVGGGADTDGEPVGLLQCVLLTETEAWAQGMRVAPAHRGEGIAARLSRTALAWARERGATVCRNMVFSWNVAGLGHSRDVGFDPGTEFRYAMPEPDADAEPSMAVVADPDAGWSFWTDSDARTALAGLGLDAGESWAASELRRSDLRRAAADDALFVVQDGGTRGLSLRAKTSTWETDDGDRRRRATYAVGAWDSPAACAALMAAVARDAADLDADTARVFVPEGVGWVSDLAAVRCPISDEPDFVMQADLTEPGVSDTTGT